MSVIVGDIFFNGLDIRDFKSSTSGPKSGVFDGTYRHTLKVKVRLVEDGKVNKNEVENFLNLNSHSNVQRLFGYEFDDSVHYFALQNFDLTLKELMELPQNNNMCHDVDLISIVKDITDGLKFLHDNKIYHGNMSFSNIGIDYKKKRAILCNYGLSDYQEDIFITPEELLGEKPSFKTDVFNLGIVVYYILSNGKHPFGFTKNPAMLKNLATIIDVKEMIQFKGDIRDFNSIVPLKFRAACAFSLVQKLLARNPSDRPNCDENLLDEPFFWSNYEIYAFIKNTSLSWNDASDDDKNLIVGKGSKYIKNYRLVQKLIEFREDNNIQGKSIIELIKFIASKIKHYEDEFYNGTVDKAHIFYYLQEIPSLFRIIYLIENEVFGETIDDLADDLDNNINMPENQKIAEILSKANLPHDILISPGKVEKSKKPIKESNAKVYFGKYNGIDVAIKEIEKSKFHIREVKNHYKMSYRKSECSVCKKIECENIIKFYGCYEDKNYYCMVFERAENDLSFSKYKFDDKLRFIHDAAKGLECLHAAPISHQDIKPQNILIVKRNGILIGCLADFGESVEAIKKTYTKTHLRMTDGYCAPELLAIARHQANRPKGLRRNEASINYARCDVYSLGMVILKDLICIKTSSIKMSPSYFLHNFRRQGKISLECEELPIYMTEECPTSRPDAQGVHKNPFFWTHKKKFEFLKAVDEFGHRHKTDQNRKKQIKKEARRRLFVLQTSGKTSWLDFLTDDQVIYEEIDRYVKSENKDPNSIFDLIEMIILICKSEPSQYFIHTKRILMRNFENYLNFWFKKFELIGFLYYYMHDDLKMLYPEYYSVDSPKRLFPLKKRLTIDEGSTTKTTRTKTLRRIDRSISK